MRLPLWVSDCFFDFYREEKFMRRVKRGFSLILCLAVLTCTLTGCYRKAGDFLLEKRGDSYMIMDLTEEGYQKKELFVYAQIGRFKISLISCRRSGMFLSPEAPVINSQVLEKIYFVDYIPSGNYGVFYNCDNLTRIIRLEAGDFPNDNDLFRNSPSDEPSSKHINQYLKYEDYLKLNHWDFVFPANVSYYLNYEIENHDGYHWIDDYDYGTKITYIPPEPTREGYTFDGWYKEEDCINKWNFETDTLPEAILDEEGEPVYQETKLYAKWIRESF